MTRLSILSVALGIGAMLPQAYGLVKPAEYAGALRKFPRSTACGVALTLLATSWFLYNLSQESIADFAAYKGVMYLLFAGVGIGSCIFVRDFLAVRGLALILLLLAKLMVDTGRPALPNTAWVEVIQFGAYVLVIAGMWLTISPWRLRDWLGWVANSEKRLKAACGVSLAFGVALVAIGVIKF
jgi:hypothetical protein